MSTIARIAPALAALTLVIAASAPAVTVYDNFGPDHDGFDYNWGLGWTVAGTDVPAQFGVEQAMAFTSPASGVLADIWIAMWYVPIDPQPDEVVIYLVHDPDGQPPQSSNILQQWTLTEFGSWSQWNPPHHLQGDGVTELMAGETYWLWAVGGPTTWCGWCMNLDPSLLCAHAMRREGEDWLPVAQETASAFRVDLQEAVATQTTTWSEVKRLFN